MVSAAGGVPIDEDSKTVFQYIAIGGRAAEGHSISVICTKAAHDQSMKALRSYAASLRKQAKERFLDCETVIPSFSMFDFDRMSCGEEAMSIWGNNHLDNLFKHYGEQKTRKDKQFEPIITDKVYAEWDILKRLVQGQGFTMEKKSTFKNADAHAWILTSTACQEQCPNCIQLLLRKMVLWLQTATCERGFSARTLIKTKERASTGNTLLDILMMVYLNGPDLADKDSCSKLIGRAVMAFLDHTNRYPARSSRGIKRRKCKPIGIDAITALAGHADALYNDNQDTDEEADASKNQEQQEEEEEEEEDTTMTLEDEQRLLEMVDNYKGEFNELPEKATRTVKWMTRNKSRKVAIKRWSGWEVGVITAWHKKKWWVRFPRKLNTTGPIEQYAVDLQDDQYGASGMWLFPKAA